jgi:hypothetical protein
MEAFMSNRILTTYTRIGMLSAALLLGTAAIGAHAAGISIGGNSLSATVGGGNGNVAGAHVGAADNGVDVNIGSGSGPLATVDNSGDPLGSGSQTNAAVNLGSLFEGIDLGGGDGAGNGGGDNGGGISTGGGGGGGITLTANDRQLLKTRCRNVLGSPDRFEANIVSVCRLIAKM